MAIRGDAHREIERLLREAGAKLERTKTHHVYKFPDGQIWVVPGTPTAGGMMKNLADLKRRLGVREPKKHSDRPYRRRGERAKVEAIVGHASLRASIADQLKWAIPENKVLRVQTVKPCRGAVHLERFPTTPLFTILARLF